MVDRDRIEVQWTTSYHSHKSRRSTVERRLRRSDTMSRYNALSALHSATYNHIILTFRRTLFFIS